MPAGNTGWPLLVHKEREAGERATAAHAMPCRTHGPCSTLQCGTRSSLRAGRTHRSGQDRRSWCEWLLNRPTSPSPTRGEPFSLRAAGGAVHDERTRHFGMPMDWVPYPPRMAKLRTGTRRASRAPVRFFARRRKWREGPAWGLGPAVGEECTATTRFFLQFPTGRHGLFSSSAVQWPPAVSAEGKARNGGFARTWP
jgi:hypothetical protein